MKQLKSINMANSKSLSESDENSVSLFLKEKGLIPIRFKKDEMQKRKTPDFKVQNETGKLLCYCEVKTISEDTWLDQKLDCAQPGTVAGGERQDPVLNNISKKIHEAVGQFDSVNSDLVVPNVLFFVSHEKAYNFKDMLGVLTGYYYADSGRKHPIFKNFSEGRIKEEKKKIQLFFWFKNKVPIIKYLIHCSGDRRKDLCTYFNLDPGEVKEL